MTCKDCRKYNNCLESSRMYPCTVFIRKDGGRNAKSSAYKRTERGRDS